MTKRLQLFLKISLLFLPFIAANTAICMCGIQLKKNYMERFTYVPKEIEVANLGSSHGGSFFYNIDEFKGLNCFNFANAQQTLDLDYALLRQYVKNFKKNSTLIICLSSFETNGIPSEELTWNSRQRYYSFLKGKYIENFSYSDWFFYKYLPLLSAKDPSKDLKKAFDIIFKIKSDELPAETEEECYDNIPDEEKSLKAEKFVKYWKFLFPPSDEGKDFNRKYLDLIINLCREHDINTVVVTTPISREAYNALAEDKQFCDVQEFHNQLKLKYPDTKFLNYIDLYFDQNKLFKDTNHLNAAGAKEFSKVIFKDLKSFGLIDLIK